MLLNAALAEIDSEMSFITVTYADKCTHTLNQGVKESGIISLAQDTCHANSLLRRICMREKATWTRSRINEI